MTPKPTNHFGIVTRQSRKIALFALLGLTLSSGNQASGQGFFKRFIPVDRVHASTDGDFTLTQDHGPWLISVATFNGDQAEADARALVLELRRRFNLHAYVHDMEFRYDEEMPGRGIDQYGGRIKRRYQRGSQVREWAVLIGDFPAIDDPQAQKLLQDIKDIEPDALTESGESLSAARRLTQALASQLGRSQGRGPLSKAFMTPNPLLPKEFFAPKGVDSFVEKMNQGVDHSALDIKGKYTVKVATFRGGSSLERATTSTKKSFWGGSKKEKSPLVEAAENAHLLTEELRRHNWEAYEFHDRTESFVVIGSFDEPASRRADGSALLAPEVQHIVETFGAAYDTPPDPLSGLGNDHNNIQKVEFVKQQFSQQITQQIGQVANGFHPKHAKIFDRGLAKSRRVVRTIPFDIHPQVVETPRRSVSSMWAR